MMMIVRMSLDIFCVIKVSVEYVVAWTGQRKKSLAISKKFFLRKLCEGTRGLSHVRWLPTRYIQLRAPLLSICLTQNSCHSRPHTLCCMIEVPGSAFSVKLFEAAVTLDS